MKIKEYKNQAKFFLERKITALYLHSKRDEKLDLLENCLTLDFAFNQKQETKKRMEQMNLAEIFKRKVIERKSIFLREYGLSLDDDGVDSCFAFLYTAGAISEEENELAELLFELSYQMAMQNLKSIGA